MMVPAMTMAPAATAPTTERVRILTASPTPRVGAEDQPPSAPAVAWVTLADGQPGPRSQALPTPGRTLAQLVVAALVVFGLVLIGTSVAASRLAEREAVNDAAHTANLLAQAVVQPALTEALVAGDQAAYAAFDRIVRDSVLPNNIVRVKLWKPDGTIVYADETRLVGQRFPLDPEQLDVLTTPQTKAEVSDLDRSENEFERYGGKLLEVYRPVWSPSGQPLLFEVYGAYAPVAERTSDLWRGLAGLLASSLLLLFVLMTPILWKVLGRLRQAHEQREALLRRAVDASEEERRRIAATLHDGPVQELVASSLVVAGVAEQAAAAGQPAMADDIREAGGTVRATVASLRSLLVDLYPDRLADAGLAAAVDDLARPLRSRGTTVTVDLDPATVVALDEESTHLIYRVTRECLRNVAKHAGACTVSVTLAREVSTRHTELVVEDNGVGFDVAASRTRHGHFGLRVLTDLAEGAGAVLQVASAPGVGTRWRLLLPPPSGGMP
jgi:two-component system NarL family sensor kinase